MSKLAHRFLISACMITTITALTGCSAAVAPIEETTYRTSMQQLPAKPTYHRLRWVHLPSLIPYHVEEVSSDVPQILPVISLDIQDATLEEAARVLAATGKYSSFCASEIAKRKLSIKAIGTVDQLAKEIAKRAQVDTLVDHQNKEIRFLAQNS